MKILDWEKPKDAVDDSSYREIQLRWKAKLFTGKDPRVEIRKLFNWFNHKKYPHNKSYGAQILIVVRLNPEDEPDILISANGKIALSNAESIMLQMAIEEAKLILQKLKETFPIKKKKIVSKN
jgi:hypothetical protein